MKYPIHECRYKINYVNEKGTIPHTHTVTSEIIQTFENTGNILINGELYRMQKNGLYFIYGLTTHLAVPDDLTRYNHSIILLNTPETEKMCADLFMTNEYKKIFTERGGTFCPLTPENIIKVDSIFLNIYNLMSSNDDTLKFAQLASNLVKLFNIGIKSCSANTNTNSKIADIISYISDNALTKITIDDICKKTHISKYHLCRTFKENVGITIGEFIKSKRLSIAKQLLSETNLSITRIAHRCCFTDASFFSKTFSKEFGMTPTAFRAKYR